MIPILIQKMVNEKHQRLVEQILPDNFEMYKIAFSVLLLLFAVLFSFSSKFREPIIKYVSNNLFFVSALGIFVTIYIVARFFFYKEIFAFLFFEDGLFENATAVFFILAFVFFLAIAVKSSIKNNHTRFVVILLALFSFFVGMEEISWGQRLFNIETPEYLQERNYQEELTVHNLISARYYTYLYFVISVCFLIFFAFSNSKYKSFLGVKKEYLPSKKFLGIALLLPLIAFADREYFEFVLSFIFFIYAFQLFKKTRLTKQNIPKKIVGNPDKVQ
ncbi:hypothetical protein K8352_10545 [Flavobacteriaceae bacterium F89]|uniref:Uncharacterized protein n=1 Tax=Cerina litoralis TaxID=2874477 RepID=A0AAE3EU89_9FLAO|nr:hypothetical protein [Cerina litoralis]MCG2461187.1 hypothetical protein [Cerina litoralis]